MPQSRGKARRAQKQKKRRQGRRKVRAGRRQHRPAAAQAGDVTSAGAEHSGSQAAAGSGELSAAQLAAIGYDPRRDPEPEEWLLLDEGERMSCIQQYHQALPSQARPPNLLLHASLHLIVENQLASDDPSEVRPALARLMADGMSRHDALHALGWLVMTYVKRVADNPADSDTAAYQRQLAQIDRQRWLQMIQERS